MRRIDRVLQRWRMRVARPWVRPGSRVLDIGCYQGEFLRSLGARIHASLGLDPLANPCDCPTFALRAEPFPPRSPLPPESFDAIVILATLEHVLEKQAFASERYRLLIPGGRVVVTVPSVRVDALVAVLCRLRLADGMSLDEHHGFDPATTTAIFERAGFSTLAAARFQLGLNNLFVFGKP